MLGTTICETCIGIAVDAEFAIVGIVEEKEVTICNWLIVETDVTFCETCIGLTVEENEVTICETCIGLIVDADVTICETCIGLIIEAEVTICIGIARSIACTPTDGLNLPMTIVMSGTVKTCLYTVMSKRGSCGSLRAVCTFNFRFFGYEISLGILSILVRNMEKQHFRNVTFSPDTRTRGVGRKNTRIFDFDLERYILPCTGAGGGPSG